MESKYEMSVEGIFCRPYDVWGSQDWDLTLILEYGPKIIGEVWKDPFLLKV